MPFLIYLKILLNIFLTLITLIFFSFLLILFSPIYLFRVICANFLIKYDISLAKILNTRNSIAAADEIYKNPKFNIVATLIFEGKIEIGDVIKDFSTISELKNENGEILRPELKQFVKPYYGFMFWANDLNFNIQNHVRILKSTENELINLEKLSQIINEQAYKPFVPFRSPWEFLILHNFKNEDEKLCSVLIIRVHHCMMDGFSILSFVNDFANPGTVLKTRNLTSPIMHIENPKIACLCSSFSSFLINLFKVPYEMVSNLNELFDKVSSIHPQKLENKISSAISLQVPIEEIKEVKLRHGVSFTTIILACYGAALRRLILESGEKVPDKIHCMAPVPVPGHPEKKLRNWMAGLWITLPLGLEDSKSRLDAIEENLNMLRVSTAPKTLFTIIVLYGGVFNWIIKKLLKNNLTLAFSNFPGPHEEWSYLGQKVLSIFFTVGTGEGNCGLGFSCLSYNEKLNFLVSVDQGIFSKLQEPAEKMINYFNEELESLKSCSLLV